MSGKKRRRRSMDICAVAKPSAYMIKAEEAKMISEKEKDPKEHDKMLAAAKRFEELCMQKKTD